MADQRATFERPSPGHGQRVRPHRMPRSQPRACWPLTLCGMAFACGPGPRCTVRRYKADVPSLAGPPLRVVVSIRLDGARTANHASAIGSRR